MRVRQGFVSNSSSSSFIVAFSEMPKNEDELRKMMFGDAIYHSSIYDDDRYTTMEIARCVWNDMQHKADKDEWGWVSDGEIEYADILSEMESGWIKGEPENPYRQLWNLERGSPEYQRIEDDYNVRRRQHNTKLRDSIFTQKDRFFKLTYEDDSQFGSMMEHSGIFNRLRHVRISKH